MKRIFFTIAVFVTTVYVFSCNKTSINQTSCSGPAAVTDSTALLAFAKTYGITPTADTSWMYYQIITPGTGASPVAKSKVFVRYAVRYMDGTYIDSTTTAHEFELDSLIAGWQYGLPKIKAGGEIKLLLPSELAYGCQGSTNIQSNSPLYFNIYLDSLK
jgi:FKBP-type peptidyl-prolyl cis-trans isomerase FkpA